MLYDVILYYNTGFNMTDIPDSKAILDAWTDKKTFPQCWLLQSRFLAFVKIKGTYQDFVNADYATIGNDCYYVMGFTMANQNMAYVMLSLDAICTIGAANMFLTGQVVRRHVATDEWFANTIDEPFQPTEKLTISDGVKMGSRTDEILSFVTTSVSLTPYIENIDLPAITFLGETDEATGLKYSVTVPELPNTVGAQADTADDRAKETIFTINNMVSQRTLPATAVYLLNKVPSVTMRQLRSVGIEVFTDSYSIPSGYVNASSGMGVPVKTMSGVSVNVDTGLTIEKYNTGAYPMQVKNKKAYSGQFYKFIIASTASGDAKEYSVDDIYHYGQSSENTFYVCISSDVTPNGKPYCRPRYINGQGVNPTELASWSGVPWLFYQAVAGATWNKAPIVYNESLGSAWAQAEARQSVRKSDITIERTLVNNAIDTTMEALGAFGGAFSSTAKYNNAANAGNSRRMAGGLMDIGGAATDTAGIVQSVYNDMKDYEQSMLDYVATTRNAARTIYYQQPEITFPYTSSLQVLTDNAFIAYTICMSKNDIKRFDDFLNRYGYAVNEVVSGSLSILTCRQNFNYVKMDSVNVSTSNNKPFSMAIRNRAAMQLQQGVRIWHKAYTPGDLNALNPIV